MCRKGKIYCVEKKYLFTGHYEEHWFNLFSVEIIHGSSEKMCNIAEIPYLSFFDNP